MQNKKDLLPAIKILVNFKFIPQHTIKSCYEYTSLIININNYNFSCLKHLILLLLIIPLIGFINHSCISLYFSTQFHSWSQWISNGWWTYCITQYSKKHFNIKPTFCQDKIALKVELARMTMVTLLRITFKVYHLRWLDGQQFTNHIYLKILGVICFSQKLFPVLSKEKIPYILA